jgi:hypothetical protein
MLSLQSRAHVANDFYTVSRLRDTLVGQQNIDCNVLGAYLFPTISFASGVAMCLSCRLLHQVIVMAYTMRVAKLQAMTRMKNVHKRRPAKLYSTINSEYKQVQPKSPPTETPTSFEF